MNVSDELAMSYIGVCTRCRLRDLSLPFSSCLHVFQDVSSPPLNAEEVAFLDFVPGLSKKEARKLDSLIK